MIGQLLGVVTVLDWEAGDVGSSPGFNTGLFCDLMESLWALVYKRGNNKT